MKRGRLLLLPALLLLLLGITSDQSLPPMPPGFRPTAALLSPKDSAYRASLGTPMTKAVAPRVLTLPQGFAITNVSIDAKNVVTIQWQNGSPPFTVEGSPDLSNWVAIAQGSAQAAVFAAGQNHFWRVRYSAAAAPGSLISALAATSPLYANVRRVATSASGSIAFAGNLFNSVNWGNGSIVSGGGSDSMIGVVNNGAAAWTKAIGSNNDHELAQATAFDSQGNLWVLGDFLAPNAPGEDFGGQFQTSLSTSPNVTAYLVKYDGSSTPPNILLLSRFGTSAGCYTLDLAVDLNDNVYAAFGLNAATTFGPFTLRAGCGIVKFNSAGVPQWATQVGSAGDHSIVCITADSNGTIAIGGTRWSGVNNGYVQKYSSNGALLWERAFANSGAASDSASGVALNSTTGQLVVTGICGRGTDFGGPITDFFGHENTNGGTFIASYSADNAFLWAKTPNVAGYTASVDQGFAAGIEQSSGNVFFCGKAGGGIYLGNADGLILLGGQGSFLASLQADATPRWGFRSGGATGFGETLAIGPNGTLVMGGQVSNNRMYFNNADHSAYGSVTTGSGTTAPFVAVFNQ